MEVLEKNIAEGNKLIVEFIGAWITEKGLWYLGGTHRDLFPNGNHYARQDQLQYHSSWDWLMPVVEKIENLEIDEFRPIAVDIEATECEIKDYSEKGMSYAYAEGKTKIEATWLAVVDFIQWYNKESK